MVTKEREFTTPPRRRQAVEGPSNGAAMAAFLGAGIGAFAVGMFALLNEMGVFSAPALYAPAGGVSGRTTFAVVVWLVAWGVLHTRWKERQLAARPVGVITAILVALGIFGTFPPLWGVLS